MILHVLFRIKDDTKHLEIDNLMDQAKNLVNTEKFLAGNENNQILEETGFLNDSPAAKKLNERQQEIEETESIMEGTEILDYF